MYSSTQRSNQRLVPLSFCTSIVWRNIRYLVDSCNAAASSYFTCLKLAHSERISVRNSNYIIENWNFTFMWPYIATIFILINQQTHQFRTFILSKNYMFRTVPLSIISFPLYIQHWYMSCRFDDIYQYRMYSGKLPMMGRGTARNM
jgi:hypothetical protein